MSEAIEKPEIYETENNVLHSKQSKIVTEITSNDSQVTANNADEKSPDGAAEVKSNDVVDGLNSTSENSKAGNIIKNKRKRRRGKPKANAKLYKKSNWKFQMPPRYRYRNRENIARDKLLRSRCIVPYNTNKFLMEEHMSEVPSALLTPSGRTRDSSFSVDSEDNYFYSMAEDEEEFLAKEFTNVYERARVERLESMSKQQLIEECLQLEDRYMETSEHQHQHGNNIDLINKIKFLEDKVCELTAENLELRRKLEYAQNKLPQEDRMVSSSEDSESDSTSSSSSSSSCGSSEYGPNSSLNTNESENAHNNHRMESDDVVINNQNNDENNQQQPQLENGNGIICNGHLESSPSLELNSLNRSFSQRVIEDANE